MGVSGSGKTTIGKLLSKKLNYHFVDADDFHTEEAIEDMRNGIALSVKKRKYWIDKLFAYIGNMDPNIQLVVACSALTRVAQQMFKMSGFHIIHLEGDFKIIQKRIKSRKGHFFFENLLSDQFKTLDNPEPDLTLNTEDSPESLIDQIVTCLNIK